MARVTPPIGANGIFQLRAPFSALTTVSYRVGAERTFEELLRDGEDALSLVYTPVGLTQTELDADKAAGALIVVLLSDTQAPIFVPDTYIDSYPDMGIVAHSWCVATISLGMLPDTMDTSGISKAIQEAVSDYTGVESTVQISKAPTTDVVTQAQYVQNVAARQAAIKNRTSTYAANLALTAQVAALQNQLTAYLTIIDAQTAKIAELEGSAPSATA